MIAWLTGLIPLVTKAVERWVSNKETDKANDFELKKIEAQSKASLSVEAAKAAAEANAEAAKAQAEAAKAEAEVEIKRLEVIQATEAKTSGIKWIDASISLVRALFGYAAVFIFIMSGINLWSTGSPLLQQTEFSECFFSILLYFFAERSCKKAFSKK